MIEVGQPRGLTGRLQSIQWAAMYGAMLLTGVTGGYLSARGAREMAFLLCAALWAFSFVITWRFARETPRPRRAFRATAADLRAAVRVPGLVTIALFLFVWSFNPSWESVQYLHVTQTLGFGEQVYGTSSSCFAAGALLGSIAYGLYCRRVALGRLVHLAILTGILGYALYLELSSPRVLYAVAFLAGAANMTGNLVQLDLAARLVPLRVAATCFAVLMSVTNLAAASSEALGGLLYQVLGDTLGMHAAYRVVVLLSALSAAACWLLVPRLRRAVPQWWQPVNPPMVVEQHVQ